MKAVVCEKPGELTFKNVPKPEVPQGWLLIKVHRVGICGTDFHIFNGRQPYLDYPRVMGHELSGVVEKGALEGGFSRGDSVIINPYFSCGDCIACQYDKPNCCVNIKVLGVHRDGGMCEYVVAPPQMVYSTGGLTLDQAAMVEFLSVGVHAVRRGKINRDHRVLVVGLGPIGLAVALFSRLAGADVTVIDSNKSRVTKAKSTFGFQQALCVARGMKSQLSEITHNEFFDAVFDATGSAKAIEKGFEYVAHCGTYVLVSIVKEDISFSDAEFHKREMKIVASRNATRNDFETVIRHILNGDIPTGKLHSHTCQLKELPEKLPEWSTSQETVVKAIATISG